jgi:hypothetical protein
MEKFASPRASSFITSPKVSKIIKSREMRLPRYVEPNRIG